MITADFSRLQISLPEFLVADEHGWVHFLGQRIGISSVVRPYQDGYSPEMLASEYPTLSLATIHKTIAIFLEHRDTVERYLDACDEESAVQRGTGIQPLSLDELRQHLAGQSLAK